MFSKIKRENVFISIKYIFKFNAIIIIDSYRFIEFEYFHFEIKSFNWN